MTEFIHFIQEWGYIAVFLGSLIEGESIILTASAMASQGYLDIFKVTVIAFIGTTLADQLLYFLGYYYGDRLFEKFPSLDQPSKKAFYFLHKYDIWFIIACRFIYGIRVASAIVIGAAKIPAKRFIPLNILSALIWAIISCGSGFYLGEILFDWFEHSENIQRTIFYGITGITLIILIFFKIRKIFKK